jgi:dipeptidyl aminopeptidase/acylaminoacyl peptidase
MVGRWVQIIHRLPDDASHVLVIERTHDSERPVARRMNINSEARLRNVAISPLSRGGLGTNPDGEVLFAYGISDDFEPEFAFRASSDASWQTFDNPFGGSVAFHSFDESGEYVYISTRDQARMGLHRLHLASGRSEPVLVDERYEMLSAIWDFDGTRIIGAVFNTPKPEARWLEPEHPTARMVRSLINALPNYNVLISNFSDDGSRAIVNLSSDREPGVFMMLNTESMAMSELVAARQWVDASQMAEMRPIEVVARDGLKLTGFLTLPNGVEPEGLPLVVEVHGGPHGPFDRWLWQPWVQAMASRGYAVLQVNFRGSGGYGQQFEESGYQRWGDKMQDDLTDAVQWAIEEGIAHPDRVCISGASYGGYSAMMSVVREPELYRCAFAFVGVYDLERARREGNIARRLGYGRAYLDRAIGSDPEQLRAHSPVHHVDRIQAELFIAHGAADEQAHYNQYHVLIDALDKAGIAHEKLFVSGEGHGFYKLENNVELYSRALRMFDRTIGSGWVPRTEQDD